MHACLYIYLYKIRIRGLCCVIIAERY